MNDARQDSIHMDDEKPGAQVVETSQHEQSSDHPIFEALLRKSDCELRHWLFLEKFSGGNG